MKLLIDQKGKKYLFKEKDIHTKDGFISADAITNATPGTQVETNKGVVMTVVEASFLDLYWKIKRSPQIIPLKDLGFIAAEVGVGSDWTIVDAGAGSGGAACFFAHLCSKGKVYTYDIREDHVTIVQKNIDFLGLMNVVVKQHDVCLDIPVKNADMVLLDVPNPWDALHHAFTALKHGGWIVSYSPCIPQVMDVVTKAAEIQGLLFVKTCEITEREWDVSDRKVRPKSQAIGHSGFLTFIRKL